MKLLNTKRVALNNITIKTISLIFGYSFWAILIQMQVIKVKYDIPLCFYGLNHQFKVSAPPTIKVLVSGKRLDIKKLKTSKFAAHVDITKYQIPGNYEVKLLESNIFLHNNLKLLNYWPSIFSVRIEEKINSCTQE